MVRSITRRALAGAVAALPIVGAAAITATTHPDAAILAADAEYRRLQDAHAALMRGCGSVEEERRREPAALAFLDQQDEPAVVLVEHRATTPEGLRAKARAVAVAMDHSPDPSCHGCNDSRMLASLLRDLIGEA